MRPNVLHRLPNALLVLALWLTLAPLQALAQSGVSLFLPEVTKGATQSAATLEFTDFTREGDRLKARMRLIVPQYLAEIDRFAHARGNLGTSDMQLFWQGPTRVVSGDGGGFTATTRVKAEMFVTHDVLFQKLRTKVMSTTGTVEMRFVPDWNAMKGIAGLRINAARVRDLPAQINGFRLDNLGNAYSVAAGIPLDTMFLFNLQSRFTNTAFAPFSGGVGFVMTAEAEVNAGVATRFALEQNVNANDPHLLWEALARRTLSPVPNR